VTQGDGRLERVADLAAVPGDAFASAFVKVALGEFEEGVLVEDDLDFGGFVVLFEPGHDVGPHLPGRVQVDGGVVEGDVDTGFEGFVDDTWAVGDKEKNAGVVFELAEENCSGELWRDIS
jgi:hypothetical protein